MKKFIIIMLVLLCNVALAQKKKSSIVQYMPTSKSTRTVEGNITNKYTIPYLKQDTYWVEIDSATHVHMWSKVLYDSLQIGKKHQFVGIKTLTWRPNPKLRSR